MKKLLLILTLLICINSVNAQGARKNAPDSEQNHKPDKTLVDIIKDVWHYIVG